MRMGAMLLQVSHKQSFMRRAQFPCLCPELILSRPPRRPCPMLAILHVVPRLTAAIVHADPAARDGVDYHELSGHHRGPGRDTVFWGVSPRSWMLCR